MPVQDGKVFLLCHPSYDGAGVDCEYAIYDVVTAVVDMDGELVGWRSVITGLSLSLAVRGLDDEWKDRVIPLPAPTSKRWQIVGR